MVMLPLKSNLDQLKMLLSDPAKLKALSSDPSKLTVEQVKGLLGMFRGVRKQSAYVFLGLPLYSIAFGPDLEKGEVRGHAKGVAVGAFAKGGIAIGAGAIGVLAMGGGALGLVTVGGLAVGLLCAVGGGAIGLIASGGVALGVIAVGGVAAGYYAVGGVAYGTHIWDAIHRDPEAIAFLSQWEILRWLVPGLRR